MAVTVVGEEPRVLEAMDLDAAMERRRASLATYPRVFALIYTFGLLAFEYALPPLGWKLRPFSRLPFEKRMAYVVQWERSRWQAKRNLLMLMRLMTLADVMVQPAMLEWIGYGESWRHRTGNPPRRPNTDYPPCPPVPGGARGES